MKKRIFFTALWVMLLVCMLACPAFAEDGIQLQTGTVNVSLQDNEHLSASVTAMRVQVKMTGENADVGSFIPSNKNNFAIQEVRYNKRTQILTIYVADDEPLFNGESTLELGYILDNDITINPLDENNLMEGLEMSANGVKGEPEKKPTQPEDPSDDSSPSGGGGTPGLPRPPVEEPSFSELDEVLNLVAQYHESDYTPESYAALRQALQQAQDLKNRTDVTEKEIENICIALQNAIGMLVPSATSKPGTEDTGSSSVPTAPPVIPIPDTPGGATAPGAGQSVNSTISGQGGGDKSGVSSEENSTSSSGTSSGSAAVSDTQSSSDSSTDVSESNSGSSTLSSSSASDSTGDDDLFRQDKPETAESQSNFSWILILLILLAAIVAALAVYFTVRAQRGRQHGGNNTRSGSKRGKR